MLGTRLRDFKRADRYVEVKGLVDRTVKSDRATWPLSFSEAGDSLPEVFASSERDKAAVVFSISAENTDSTSGGEDGNNYMSDQQAAGSIMKKVRVVSTIDYYLVN